VSSQFPTFAALSRVEELARLGLFTEAQAVCGELLAQVPQEHRAWHWLGLLNLAQNRFADAEPALRQALAIYPQDARYWNSFGLALRGQGRSAEAEVAMRNALTLADVADYWAGLGNCLFDQQRLEEAAGAYQQALARNPQDAQTWTNLGGVEQTRGQLAAAQEAYERSLALAPGDLQTETRSAHLDVQRGEVHCGVQRARSVLQRSPKFAPAWLVLGSGERLLDNLQASAAAYRQAVQFAPGDRIARFNLALVLLQQLSLSEAEFWAQQLIAENDSDADAWIVLGGALLAQARVDDAIAAMRRCVELAPTPTYHGKLLGALHYADSVDPVQLLKDHEQWDAMHARPLMPTAPPAMQRQRGEFPLRLGLVGSDFCASPTGYLALPGLEHLDKTQCSVICYSDRLQEDAHTARTRAMADVFRTTMSLSDAELAQQIVRDEIDVLVDLGGHVGRRLLTFARRPAPVQITWLGYVGTTGLAAMDGLLADRFHVRSGEEAWYTETVLRMPHDYICYGPPPLAPQVGSLPAGERGRITLGCFNHPAKYSPRTLDTWAAILRRVPTARLFLKYSGLEQPDVQGRFRAELAARGIEEQQLIVEGGTGNLELLATYNQIDLALDTMPYSGGLTTCEALWMGVPVLTCPGRTFASRHSTSHITNAGYPQFVAKDREAYVELAVQWAARLEELAAIRAQMREQVRASALCDSAAFAHDLLKIFQEAWQHFLGEREAGHRREAGVASR
jgi:protein O-GlcNAc transferase